MSEPDRAADVAWMIIKVIINLIRFFVGSVFAVLFLLSLISLGGHGIGDGDGVLGPILRVLILGVLAFCIWPQRYGPPTKIIEAWQKTRSSRPLPVPNETKNG